MTSHLVGHFWLTRSFDTTHHPDGAYQLEVEASDTRGNNSTDTLPTTGHRGYYERSAPNRTPKGSANSTPRLPRRPLPCSARITAG
jgi:hypothetical protein